jgi:uncharacterized protein YbjT (DUF2867 family)
MKYVITGASGNTGKIIAKNLLQAGKQVIAVSRNESKIQDLLELGATVAIGDLEDTDFLTNTLAGADAVYALNPPKFDLQEDWRVSQDRITDSFIEAIRKSKIKNVVLLSSAGSHLPSGTGPVAGLYYFEELLKKIDGLNVFALRPGFFIQNLYAQIPLIKQAGIVGYSLKPDVEIPFTHTNDIAEAATEKLLNLNFIGFEKGFVSGAKDYTMPEIATILGNAIGKPDLSYVSFSNDDAKAGMVQSGLPETVAAGYVELFDALNQGTYLNDYTRTPENTTKTTVEDFAPEFAAAYIND